MLHLTDCTLPWGRRACHPSRLERFCPDTFWQKNFLFFLTRTACCHSDGHATPPHPTADVVDHPEGTPTPMMQHYNRGNFHCYWPQRASHPSLNRSSLNFILLILEVSQLLEEKCITCNSCVWFALTLKYELLCQAIHTSDQNIFVFMKVFHFPSSTYFIQNLLLYLHGIIYTTQILCMSLHWNNRV